MSVCDLLPLSLRRDFLDIVLMYNCINDKIDFNILNVVHFLESNVNTRLHDDAEYKLTVVNPRLEFCRNFYPYRIIHTWNAVPTEIIEIELSPTGSNSSFKNNLKLWFKNKVVNFDSNNLCTWMTVCKCARCRII